MPLSHTEQNLSRDQHVAHHEATSISSKVLRQKELLSHLLKSEKIKVLLHAQPFENNIVVHEGMN